MRCIVCDLCISKVYDLHAKDENHLVFVNSK